MFTSVHSIKERYEERGICRDVLAVRLSMRDGIINTFLENLAAHNTRIRHTTTPSANTSAPASTRHISQVLIRHQLHFELTVDENNSIEHLSDGVVSLSVLLCYVRHEGSDGDCPICGRQGEYSKSDSEHHDVGTDAHAFFSDNLTILHQR